MKIVYIDGEKISSKKDFFRAWREGLGTDALIGDNLDALFDVLSVRTEPLGVVIVNTEALRAVRGIRWDGLVRLLEDVTDERPEITVLIDPFCTDPLLDDIIDE